MVQLVLLHIWEELCQLVVVVGSCSIVLDVEVAVGQEGEGGAVTWTELKLICEDSNHLYKSENGSEKSVVTE